MATQDAVFGLARMFDIFVQGTAPERSLAVFRDWEKAAVWLGQDLAEAERVAAEIRGGADLAGAPAAEETTRRT